MSSNGKPKTSKVRLDELLVARGEFASVEEAMRAVLAHEVRVGDEYVASAAIKVDPNSDIHVKDAKRFVSRGGVKLQGALDAFGQSVEGKRCIDIGSSTGGFTDCLLQAGAASVACVDVNYGQLAWKIRQDARVRVFERTNIKLADPIELGAPFDIIVVDVSFIGLASLAPVFARLSHGALGGGSGIDDDLPGLGASAYGTASSADALQIASPTVLIALVKPQFESAMGETDHGVVRDPQVRERTVTEVRAALEEVGFSVTDAMPSPITGPKGNVEYLVRAEYEDRESHRR